MNRPIKKIKIEDYSPIGTKSCEMKCDRKVIPGKKGQPVIICDGCKRIIMELK